MSYVISHSPIFFNHTNYYNARHCGHAVFYYLLFTHLGLFTYHISVMYLFPTLKNYVLKYCFCL